MRLQVSISVKVELEYTETKTRRFLFTKIHALRYAQDHVNILLMS